MEIEETKTIASDNSMKLSVWVSRWPFLSLSNSLGIVFSSTANKSENTCESEDRDESGSLRWILIVVDKISFYPNNYINTM